MSLRSILAITGLLLLGLSSVACAPAETGGDPASEEQAPADTLDSEEQVGDESESAPPAAGEAPAVPEGFEDAFADNGEVLVSVYDVADAQDAGMDIQFVDARPPVDMEFGHIPGAINIPYYDAEEADLSALPTDRWLVTYCECPNAEATQLADALRERGYPYVKAIEEGFGPWRDELGRPVEYAESES